MANRAAVVVWIIALVALLGCAHDRKKHALTCREKIDDCMDDCPLDPGMHDACFAGCRTNTSCEDQEQQQ